MGYIRKETYPVAEVLKHIKPHVPRQKNVVDFDGDPIELESQRYRLFHQKGTTCVDCGLVGEFFAKEKSDDPRITKYHLNLYGVRDGKEVLFTKDHILPKSKGGKNHMKNYNPMCSTCNGLKADKYEGVLPPKNPNSGAAAIKNALKNRPQRPPMVATPQDSEMFEHMTEMFLMIVWPFLALMVLALTSPGILAKASPLLALGLVFGFYNSLQRKRLASKTNGNKK